MAQSRSKKTGILAGGNWIVDHIKVIDQFPHQDGLSNIVNQKLNTGGSPYNILKNLSHLGASFKLSGIGLVGEDNNGNYILDDCIKSSIDKRGIKMLPGESTSFTDVLTVKSTGRRTFLHQKGVSSKLGTEYFRLEKYKAKIFHLGYLLLLDRLDSVNADARTEASLLFQKASEMGFKTSADLVSEESERYRHVMASSLPFIDYLFLNTFDLEKLTETIIKADGNISFRNMEEASLKLFDHGLREWVITEYKTGIFAMHASGEKHIIGKANLPLKEIAGQAGVSDAIAAAILYGLHEGWEMPRSLELAACAVACCQTDVSCTEGILPLDMTLKKGRQWGFAETGQNYI